MKRRYWPSKPPVGWQIDWSHPFAQGLVAFWAFNEGSGIPLELVSRSLPSASANFSWGVSTAGLAGSFNGSSTNLTYTRVASTTSTLSLAGSCTFNTFSAGQMLIERTPVNTVWEVLYSPTSSTLAYRGASASNRNQIPVSLLTAGQRFSWGVTDTGTGSTPPNGSTMYLNGVQQSNGAAGGGLPVSSSAAIYVGNYDGSGYFFNGTQDYISMWKYALPAATMQAIGSSPNAIWQMFQFPKRFGKGLKSPLLGYVRSNRPDNRQFWS